jgi:hypothetical protein
VFFLLTAMPVYAEWQDHSEQVVGFTGGDKRKRATRVESIFARSIPITDCGCILDVWYAGDIANQEIFP